MSDNTKSMAHEEAEKMNAVESYLLDELTDDQRVRFEEHYFECSTCADAVVAGQEFVRGIRPIHVPWWRALLAKLGSPITLPAWRLAALGGVSALSLALIGMREFSSLPVASANTAILAKPLEKGSPEDYHVRTPSVTVEFTLPYEAKPFPLYLVKMLKEKKGLLSQVVLPAPPETGERRLSLQINRTALGEGRFTVDVAGLENESDGVGSKIETYYFDTLAK